MNNKLIPIGFVMLAVLLLLPVTELAVARTCYQYTTVAYLCGAECNGNCKKYQFPAGTTPCGYCTKSWTGSCIDGPSWYVTVNDLASGCAYWQNPNFPYNWICACDGNWVQTGTSVNRCTCQ
jgi:hypothetical protein